MAASKEFTLIRGKTFSQVVRWETQPIVYAAITAISNAAPATITAPGHGLPDGWRAAVVSVKGMREINAVNTPLRDADYRVCTVIDVNTVALNEVNSSDFKAYAGGGYLQYNTPHPLTGYTCRWKIKGKVGGTLLLSTEPADAPLNLLTATVDTTAKTITLGLDALTSAALSWSKAVHEAEMVAPDGKVYPLILPSKIVVSTEVAT